MNDSYSFNASIRYYPLPGKDIKPMPVSSKNATATPAKIRRFETLLSEISATYINLPVKALERALKRDFERLIQALNVDGCLLYVASENPDTFTVTGPFLWFLDEKQSSNKRFVEWLKRNPSIDADSFPWGFGKHSKGEPFIWTGVGPVPPGAAAEHRFLSEMGVKSSLAVPVLFEGKVAGLLNIFTTVSYQIWPMDLIPRLRLFGEVFINALKRKQSDEELQKALSEIKALKERFEADYLYLKEEISLEQNFEEVVGKSDALKQTLVKAKQVASTNITILIFGETGVGKGLIARAIHNASHRKNRPMIQVNCAALSPTLIESELFGHEKGAYTGAFTHRIGRFEAANGTTLFLDEIGELPLKSQAKLLRVLEEGEFERVGGSNTSHTDVRLIVATNRDLQKAVETGKFRHDLWYRINIFPIVIPPLRERLEDIPILVTYFLNRYTKKTGRIFEPVSNETINTLQGYSWPGNVRELRNALERAIITSPGNKLHVEIPRSSSPKGSKNFKDILEKAARQAIQDALKNSGGVIDGQNGAAKQLGLTGNNLRYHMKRLGIPRIISEPIDI